MSDRLAEDDRPGVRRALDEIRPALNAYADVQRNQLLPSLLARLGEAETTARLLARSFRDGAEILHAAVERFLARYAGSTFDLDLFAHDWNTLEHALKTRLKAEESALYPLYLRVQHR